MNELPCRYSVEDWLVRLVSVPVSERVAGVRKVLAASLPRDPERAKVELCNRATLVTALRQSVSDVDL